MLLKLAKDQEPPPNYRMAAFQPMRCGTCKHFTPTGRCKQFHTPVDPQYVCDAVETKPFKPSGAFEPSSGATKIGRAREMVLKMANTRMGGQALAAGHRLATDVNALGSPIAKPGTPMNAARTVQGPGARPLTPAAPNAQMPPAMGQGHTPPPMQMPAQNQPSPGVLQQPVQAPQIPKMARASRSILKMAQDAPPQPAPGGAPPPPPDPSQMAPQGAPPAPPAGAPQGGSAPPPQDPSQGGPPGTFKPSPLNEVLAGNPTIANQWMNSIHAPMNPPAPPHPSQAQQAASGQGMQQAQGLQAAYQQSGPGKMAQHRIKTARQLVFSKLAFDPMDNAGRRPRGIAGGYGSYNRMGAVNVNGRFQAGGGPANLSGRDPVTGQRGAMPFGDNMPWGPNMTAPGLGPGLENPVPEVETPQPERWRTRAGMQATGPFNMPARYRGQRKNRIPYQPPAPTPQAQPEESIGETLQRRANERAAQGLPPKAENAADLAAGGNGVDAMTDKKKQNTIYGPNPEVPALPDDKPSGNPAMDYMKKRTAQTRTRMKAKTDQFAPGQTSGTFEQGKLVPGSEGTVEGGGVDAMGGKPKPNVIHAPDVQTGDRRQHLTAGEGMAPPGQKFDDKGIQYGDDRNTPLPQKQLVRQTYGQPITRENANNVGANVIHGPGPSDVTEERAPMGRAVPGRSGTYVPPNQTQDQRLGENMPGKGSMPEGQPQYQDPRKVQNWARDPRQIQAGRNGRGIMRTQLNQNPYVFGYIPGKTPPPPPPRPQPGRITGMRRPAPAPAPTPPAPAPQNPPAQVPGPAGTLRPLSPPTAKAPAPAAPAPTPQPTPQPTMSGGTLFNRSLPSFTPPPGTKAPSLGND